MRKTILITGASRGIGKAVASHLLDAGHRPILAMRDITSLDRSFDKDDCIEMDVSSQRSIQVAMENLSKRTQCLDGVINNAGIFEGHDSLCFPQEQVTKMFETNFLGAWRVILACLPYLKDAKQATIVNVSSMTASLRLTADGIEIPGDAEQRIAYCCVKSALNMFTIQLKQALGQVPRYRHIDLFALSPGYTATRMNGFSGTQKPEEAGAFIAAPFLEASFDRNQLFQGPEGPLEW